MKLINLSKCYIYIPIKSKKDGEITTNWQYKDTFFLNKQQDVNELDTNMAGYVDFEVLKLRTDKELNIDKGDGVAFRELNLKDSKDKPSYIVAGFLKVGRCTTYTLNTYHGE